MVGCRKDSEPINLHSTNPHRFCFGTGGGGDPGELVVK